MTTDENVMEDELTRAPTMTSERSYYPGTPTSPNASRRLRTIDPTATRGHVDHGGFGIGLSSWLRFGLDRLGAEVDVRRESISGEYAPRAIHCGFDFGGYRSGMVIELA